MLKLLQMIKGLHLFCVKKMRKSEFFYQFKAVFVVLKTS